MELAKPQEGEIFWDIGTGTGKPLILCALVYPFLKVRGVEFLGGLYETARKVRENYYRIVPEHYQV